MEGGGAALSRMRPRYHVLVFTVDVSQLLGFIISSGGAQLLAVFCKYSRTLQVLWRESWSSISKQYIILYIITDKSCVRLRMIL